MRRDDVLEILARAKPELDRMGVRSLALFGSVARDEAGPGSDVDLLVEFHETPGLFAFARLKRRLEELLGCPVDLATRGALRGRMKEAILREAVDAG